MHHGRRRVVDDGVPLSHAVIETTVQFAYTSLFGAFASYSFCRTHRLSAPVAAHVLCNYLGLPAFACLRPGPLYDYRLAFAALHVAGIALFFTRSGWLLVVRECALGLSFAVCYPMTRLLWRVARRRWRVGGSKRRLLSGSGPTWTPRVPCRPAWREQSPGV